MRARVIPTMVIAIVMPIVAGTKYMSTVDADDGVGDGVMRV